MKIKKVKYDGLDSFNDYTVELSYGQLCAARDALEKAHDNPLSDEMYAELNYYLQNIPGPGESSDQFKAERDAATKTQDQAGQEVAPGEDMGAGGPPPETGLEAGQGAGGSLPAPPTDEFGPESSPGPEGEPGEPGMPSGGGAPEGDFQEGPKLSSEERDIMDRAMQGGPGARPTGISHGVPRPPAE